MTDSITSRAISGGRVTINDGPNAGRSATTDASGAYSLTALTLGGFTARGSATGYAQLDRSVTLTQNTQANFALQPANPSFAGTWSGRVRSTACRDSGQLSGFCQSEPTLDDTLVVILSQSGSTVTGTINLGGIVVNASGTAQGNQLSLSGVGPYQGLNISYEGWATSLSGSSMVGGFTAVIFVPNNGGSARYDVNLVNVTRTASVTGFLYGDFDVSDSHVRQLFERAESFSAKPPRH